MTAPVIRLPRRFVDDHQGRELPTPAFMRFNRRHVWVRADDPALASLLDDALYYADPTGGPDLDTAGLRRAARAVVEAARRQGVNVEAVAATADD